MKFREIPRRSAYEQVQRVLSSDYRALTCVMDYGLCPFQLGPRHLSISPLHKPAKNTAILALFLKLRQTHRPDTLHTNSSLSFLHRGTPRNKPWKEGSGR